MGCERWFLIYRWFVSTVSVLIQFFAYVWRIEDDAYKRHTWVLQCNTYIGMGHDLFEWKGKRVQQLAVCATVRRALWPEFHNACKRFVCLTVCCHRIRCSRSSWNRWPTVASNSVRAGCFSVLIVLRPPHPFVFIHWIFIEYKHDIIKSVNKKFKKHKFSRFSAVAFSLSTGLVCATAIVRNNVFDFFNLIKY